MKKFLALALSAIMILAVLAGCGNAAKPAESTPETTVPEVKPAGTLMITMGASFELPYDETGKALEIIGTNAVGKTIAENVQQQVGKDCVHGVRSILRYASDNQLIGDAKTMAVRLAFGDTEPVEGFLDTIAQDTQYLADEECTGIWTIKIGEDDIDAEGFLLPETARKFAARYLGEAAADLIGEDAMSMEEVFTYSFDDKACTVDGRSGLVIGK